VACACILPRAEGVVVRKSVREAVEQAHGGEGRAAYADGGCGDAELERARRKRCEHGQDAAAPHNLSLSVRSPIHVYDPELNTETVLEYDEPARWSSVKRDWWSGTSSFRRRSVHSVSTFRTIPIFCMSLL
jgi:hypothetical protein